MCADKSCVVWLGSYHLMVCCYFPMLYWELKGDVVVVVDMDQSSRWPIIRSRASFVSNFRRKTETSWRFLSEGASMESTFLGLLVERWLLLDDWLLRNLTCHSLIGYSIKFLDDGCCCCCVEFHFYKNNVVVDERCRLIQCHSLDDCCPKLISLWLWLFSEALLLVTAPKSNSITFSVSLFNPFRMSLIGPFPIPWFPMVFDA